MSNKHPPKTTMASIANRLRGKKAKGEDDEEDEFSQRTRMTAMQKAAIKVQSMQEGVRLAPNGNE